MSAVQTIMIATDNHPQREQGKFDPPDWIASFFPTGEDRLKGDENWLSWSLAMKRLLRAAKVWDIVSGEELRPPPESVELRNWIAKDLYAQINIAGSVESQVALHIGDMSSREMWTHLQCMYQQKGTFDIVFWIRRLFRTVESTSTMTQHVESFQTALLYLADAGMNMDEYVKAAILLATLVNESDETGPDSWTSFITNFPFDKSTKMSTVIASIFDEVQRRKTKAKARTRHKSDRKREGRE